MNLRSRFLLPAAIVALSTAVGGCEAMSAPDACRAKARALCTRVIECWEGVVSGCYEDLSASCDEAEWRCEEEPSAARQCRDAIRNAPCPDILDCYIFGECPSQCNDPCTEPTETGSHLVQLVER